MVLKYVFALIVLAAVSVQADSSLVEVSPSFHNLGVNADVNQYVDVTLFNVIKFIKENGLDPMELPDVEEGFRVRYLLITYSAQFKMHSGSMTGLVNLERAGDQLVNYFAKMLRVRIQLKISNINFLYRYRVKVMNIGPTGRITGSMANFKVTFDILLDFNNDEIHLQEFKLSDITKLRVRLGGNLLTDWLVNPVISVFTILIDTVIMDVVGANIQSAVQGILDDINSGVKDVISVLESYN